MLVLGFVVARLGPGLLRSPQWRWHAVRHSVHFAAQAGWVHSLGLLPLTQVFPTLYGLKGKTAPFCQRNRLDYGI